jgi:cytochrome c peroxidase
MLRFLAIPVLALLAPLAAQTYLPPPPVPAGNPQTAAKALLGKTLFWDEQLSSTRTVACGTCHRFQSGGADPRTAFSVHPGGDGVYGTADDVHGSPGVVQQDASGRPRAAATFGLQVQISHRKAPSVINAAYARELFDDGRAGPTFTDPMTGAVVLASGGALESQIASPPVNAAEMSHLGRTWNDIAAELPGLQPLALATNVPGALQQFVAGQNYGTLFQQVFGSPGVTPVRIVFAIAAYERTLISDQTPFDASLAGQGTLPPLAQAGLVRFQTLCAGCHTDLSTTVLTTGPVLDDFRNIGLRPVAEDPGRFAVTNDPNDRGRFRVPGLRNVALRAPYFHNGGMAGLGDVVDFYARGGDSQDNQDPLVQGIQSHITIQDRLALISLLQTLTDPRVQNELPPFDRPRLWSEGPLVPTFFGTGTPGSGGLPPRSTLTSPAFLGNQRFGLGVDRVSPYVFAALALDLAANPQGMQLLGQNVYLGLTPALTLAGIPGLTQGSGVGGGYAAIVLPVPQAPGLAGATIFGQWVLLDALGPNGLASSDAFGFRVF